MRFASHRLLAYLVAYHLQWCVLAASALSCSLLPLLLQCMATALGPVALAEGHIVTSPELERCALLVFCKIAFFLYGPVLANTLVALFRLSIVLYQDCPIFRHIRPVY